MKQEYNIFKKQLIQTLLKNKDKLDSRPFACLLNMIDKELFKSVEQLERKLYIEYGIEYGKDKSK